MSRLRIAQATGFLGSGKTPFLTALAKELGDRGHKVAVIVNDVGHINVDQQVVRSKGMEVKEVAGGCICCEVQGTFSTTVMNLYMSYRPDIILVEPTGVAIPWGLKQAVEEATRKSGIEISHAPICTFVDCYMLEEQLQFVGRLIETQIMEADLVFINKADICDERTVEGCMETIRSINPQVRTLVGSGRTGQGVAGMADIIESEESGRYHEAVAEGIFKEQYGGKDE